MGIPTVKKAVLNKKRFNRIKRRIELGHGKPGDELKFKLLSKELGYDNRED